ncbi:cytochrome P450 monooxygenase [Glonium stellatum]|uniref:Cytochrome P450 monooxygenase n=1 Tax=Glonium stellatum TaxID=574774 RepID=A0A8E2EXR8_9PEZI|nr:cytochrome P450 monooxygenase [Glonium stellatum]
MYLPPLKTFTLLSTVTTVIIVAHQKGIGIISWIINRYLTWKHPISSLDKTRSIPTCPYQWPNGQGDVQKFLEGEKNSDAWGKTHGRVYRIWSGTTPEIVLTHPDDVQTAFNDSDKHSKAVNNDAGWLMGELLGKCLGLLSGVEWQKVRDVTITPFTHKNVATYITRATEISREHFRDLQVSKGLGKNAINPVDDLRFLPFWVLADIIYGELTSELKLVLKDLIPLRESLFKRMIEGGVTRFSYSQYLPTGTNKDLRKFKKKWTEFNDAACFGCRLAKEDTLIVLMYEAVKRGRVTPEQLHQTLDEMLFANLDVTIGGISWNLLFLADNQDVQAQLREEIFLMRKSKDEKKWEQYLLGSSTLLAASISESARLRPLAAFSVPQSAPTDRIIGGFNIPAGTNFIVDTHALNIRNPYWGSNSEKYRPKRFLGRKATKMRYQYWRFGFGPRQCMGKYVADLIIRVLLTHLVANYRLSLSQKSSWDKNPSVWITHPDTEIICHRVSLAE